MNSELLDRSALKAADDYCEYRRIVGDDDGGVLFTTEQYEEYKRKMLPQRAKNRLYVSFGVPGGIDCKLVGPETPCFFNPRPRLCGVCMFSPCLRGFSPGTPVSIPHLKSECLFLLYKQHKTDFEIIPSERPLLLPCRMKKCLCSTYEYLPHIGTIPIRCQCKHLPEHHNETDGHLCKTCDCSGFRSPYTCGCGQPSFNHQTLVETKSEREARGRPVGQDVPYAAMGGLTGFSSLLDGYIALEASGSSNESNDDCQERCTASRIKQASPEASSSICKRKTK
ncbi:protein FAM221A isoform X2 [Phyllopteryx taeniolatus]|uniref:protein FAM221A isoform X2 n=1 Tax=Phyllopteryx taeniolatus TaxID=161469 RepID=UPI002AD3DC43|nr:protein FAM221A isoform X2 [Phyllopteryx taeniolatus]